MALNLTNFDAALKQHYTSDRVMNLVYKNNPFLAMIPKMERFGGRNLPIPLIHGNPQGRSATFGDAQDNKGNSLVKDFVLTRVSDYSLVDIDNETIKASEGNENAFLEARVTEIDGGIQSLTRSLAISQYRSGGGAIGQAASGTAGVTITLSDANDIVNFEVGMELEGDTVDGTGTVHAGTGTITAIDRDAGTITSDSAWDTQITGLAANDYLFQEGDYGAKLSGLLAWLPVTAPSSGDSFFGVDRSEDTQRLAGVRYDASSDPIEEGVIEAVSRVSRYGGAPDYMFMSYAKYAAFEKALGSRVRYDNIESPAAEVGFRGIVIAGPKGPVTVLPDINCPNAYGFVLQMDTWKCYSLGPAPHIIETDGLMLLRNSSSDSVEARMGYYANVGCRAPGYNGVITMP